IDIRMKNLRYDTLLARIGDQKRQILMSKRRIRDLKIEAALVRRETQRKKDEIALSQGNRGFVMKDNKISSATGSAIEASKTPAKKVNVNVSFF
ncbi:MAG: hypothetical protein NT079_02485, partial [Candidatus Omnitrophica bacterium]|nr:hypothetical protein [Candidatus Omnitrophota bacterium]